MLFVAFAVQRNEAEVLLSDEIDERAGDGVERRRLVEVAIESAENPI